MGRRLAVAVAALAALAAAPAAAAPLSSIPLKIGDAVDVVGTPMACFAITSNNKDGLACVLWKGSRPRTGTYGVGLAVDGTASLNKIKADGSGQTIFKRKLQAARTVYKAHTGDLFGFQVNTSLSIACEVINVTSTAVEPDAPRRQGGLPALERNGGDPELVLRHHLGEVRRGLEIRRDRASRRPGGVVKKQP